MSYALSAYLARGGANADASMTANSVYAGSVTRAQARRLAALLAAYEGAKQAGDIAGAVAALDELAVEIDGLDGDVSRLRMAISEFRAAMRSREG